MMKTTLLTAGMLAATTQASMDMMELKINEWNKYLAEGAFQTRQSVRNSPVQCRDEDGVATIEGEDFPCKEVDFVSFLSKDELEFGDVKPHREGIPVRSADIWGWLSPTNKEFTLLCMDNGVAFIDTTNAESPCVTSFLPTDRPSDTWCDVKTFENYAYIVKDDRGRDQPDTATLGGQIIDLNIVDEIQCVVGETEPVILEAHGTWDFHGRSHNININTETGFLYSVGTEKCAQGLMMLDLNNDPLNPEFAGCADEDGYTHDVQCVIYDGMDAEFQGKEICFAFNEDTLTIWDVENKSAPEILSRTTYPGQVYCHQGWLTDDMSAILLDDELNELCSDNILALSRCINDALGPVDNITKTSTYYMTLEDLRNPILQGTYRHKDDVIDHNLYVWSLVHRKGLGGNPPLPADQLPNSRFAILNNYLAGVRILDIGKGGVETWEEVGFFDISPDQTGVRFLGAWSGYLHPSGNYAVSSIERGMFMLKPRMAYDLTYGQETPSSSPSSSPPSEGINAVGFSVILIIVLLGGLLFIAVAPSLMCRGDAADSTDAAITSVDEETKGKNLSV